MGSFRKNKRGEAGLPSIDEIDYALDILERQRLFIYSILEEQDLTSPTGFPLKVDRIVKTGGIPTEFICVSVLGDSSYDLYFYAVGSEGRDAILEKAKLLTNVGWRKKVHVYACCPYGELDEEEKNSICPLHGKNPLLPR